MTALDTPRGAGGEYSAAGRRAGLGDPQTRGRRRRTAFWPVAEHMLWIYWRYRVTMVTSAVSEPLLYLMGMGLGLGSLVAHGTGASTYGVDYVVFVAPALLVSAAAMVDVEESTYQILSGLQWDSKSYFTIYQASVSPTQLGLGVQLAIQIRVLFVSMLYYLCMLAFGVVPHPWTGLLAIPLACLGGMAFGAPVGAYFAGVEREGGRANMVRRFVLMPLVLFSGTYYPLAVLPAGIQWIGWISPIWHTTELARLLCFGHHEPAALVLAHLAFLVVLATGGTVLLVRRLGQKLGDQ